jgi:hypothetical protein
MKRPRPIGDRLVDRATGSAAAFLVVVLVLVVGGRGRPRARRALPSLRRG